MIPHSSTIYGPLPAPLDWIAALATPLQPREIEKRCPYWFSGVNPNKPRDESDAGRIRQCMSPAVRIGTAEIQEALVARFSIEMRRSRIGARLCKMSEAGRVVRDDFEDGTPGWRLR